MNFYNINLLLSVKIQAAVCDGNTIGHPCCTVHDCKLPLDNHRLRFCSHHQDHRNICAVEGCGLACSPGSNTCHITEHQQLEDAYYKPAKALFQLRARLKKAGLSIPPDSMAARQRRGGRFLLGEVLDMDGGMCQTALQPRETSRWMIILITLKKEDFRLALVTCKSRDREGDRQ